jgi:hypothetical protein
MRDEAKDTIDAAKNHWGFCDRAELVARAFNAGMVAGWNMRNDDRGDLFKSAQETMRGHMTINGRP